MNVNQFFEHHGIVRNPFAEEDAQTDPVFKDHCINYVFHPAWDKVYGDPKEPASSIVFGEKGSGKTAMRLQISQHLMDWNKKQKAQRLFIVHYDDFNPLLDRFQKHVGTFRKTEAVLSRWESWDHMDCILSLSVTSLVDAILGTKRLSNTGVTYQIDRSKLKSLSRHQDRDLLLLAACYDSAIHETYKGRWHRLRYKLRFRTMSSWGSTLVGIIWTLFVLLAAWQLLKFGWLKPIRVFAWDIPAILAVIGLGWLPRLRKFWNTFRLSAGIDRNLRVGNLNRKWLRQVLSYFSNSELSGQPVPNRRNSEDRFDSLMRLQNLLQSLGFHGIVVLMDRIDEPHLINGKVDRMKNFVWPMLDNKLLKHPGLGIKMMLPAELVEYADNETPEFFQRSRLDKQNMIRSFQWTPQSLYDVANARLAACCDQQNPATLPTMLQDDFGHEELLSALGKLRTPRQLFKFLYRLVVRHCNQFTSDRPEWKISTELFQDELNTFQAEQVAFDKGVGPG